MIDQDEIKANIELAHEINMKYLKLATDEIQEKLSNCEYTYVIMFKCFLTQLRAALELAKELKDIDIFNQLKTAALEEIALL